MGCGTRGCITPVVTKYHINCGSRVGTVPLSYFVIQNVTKHLISSQMLRRIAVIFYAHFALIKGVNLRILKRLIIIRNQYTCAIRIHLNKAFQLSGAEF